MAKFYAIRVGRERGAFNTWAECHARVNCFQKAKYKSFSTRGGALAWLGGFANAHVATPEARSGVNSVGELPNKPERKKTAHRASRKERHHARMVADARTTVGGCYFDLMCDCVPWDGCMKCIPIVESIWRVTGDVESQNIGPRQAEIGYL